MKRIITQLCILKYLVLFLTLGAFLNVNAQGQANPWCDAAYYYQSIPRGQTATTYQVALEQLRLRAASTTIINKPADGYSGNQTCGEEWRLVNSAANAVNLVAGSTYTIDASFSTMSSRGANFGAYIDLNNDKDFLDAGEYLGTWSGPSPGNGTVSPLYSRTFTIPCNISPSSTRLRVICNRDLNGVTAAMGCINCSSTSPGYGEAADISVNLTLPISVSSDFIVPTTIWIKTTATFINQNQLGYSEHAWDVGNDGTYEQRSIVPDFSSTPNTWITPGNKCLKLRSTNCLGRDSIVKCFNVALPTNVPSVDFIASKTTAEIYETVQLFDLSQNGPFEWYWDVYDSVTYANEGNYLNLDNYDAIYDDPNGNGRDRFSRNPEFTFDYPGVYTIVLTAYNDAGYSLPTKKVMYITITPPTEFLLGFGSYGPNGDNVVGLSSGTIYDNGGPNLNYGGGQGLGTRSYLQITPCNAQRIDLTMSQIKFADNQDKLRIWDGKTPGGPGTTLLANWSNTSRPPQKVSAFSGSMYILFESNASGNDSGFIGKFTSVLGSASVPTPDFEPSSDPTWVGAPVKFRNTTIDVVGVPSWEWYVDDVLVGTKQDLNYTFDYENVNGFDVCLNIKSCVGNNRTCKFVPSITPQSQTSLDLIASSRRPKIGVDDVILKPIADNANRFEWSIFPTTYTLQNPPTGPNGSSGVGFVNYINTPGDSFPTPIIKFNASGCYTITLKAWNNQNEIATTNTIVKNAYICAVEYCSPFVSILSTDVGINNVSIYDGNNVIMSNTSTSGIDGYSSYNPTPTPTLTFGKTYTLEISRDNAVDPATRKAWIDWNIDGDFTDPGEEILFELTQNTTSYSASFTVPALSQSIEGTSRLRVGISYNNSVPSACGPITVGEVEDYSINLVNDFMPPVITLLSSDTVRIEVGSTYNDAGATAYDMSEGDITSRIVTTNTLNSNVVGFYYFDYNVSDLSGNTAIPVRRVVIVVEDLTKPVLTLNPAAPGCIEARRDNAPYVDPGAIATDNKSPFNLTPSIIVTGSVDTRTEGTYTLNYYVQDVAGNFATDSRTVCVEDTKAPIIISGSDTNIQINSIWIDQTIAEDAYDLNPELVTVWGYNGPVNSSVKANYPVTYNATDAKGNVATTVKRTYRVDDFVPPTIVLNTFDVVYHEVRTQYNSVAATVTDNFYPQNQLSIIRKSTNVNPNVLGTYSEVFEAYDASGNVTEKTRTVVVRDTKSAYSLGSCN
jgi:hypothetical protein